MKKNLKLKTAIICAGQTQRGLAQKLGFCETIISKAICGRINLSKSEQKKIADALGRKREELFDRKVD